MSKKQLDAAALKELLQESDVDSATIDRIITKNGEREESPKRRSKGRRSAMGHGSAAPEREPIQL